MNLTTQYNGTVWEVLHDDSIIAWFRFESDARLFIESITGEALEAPGP